MAVKVYLWVKNRKAAIVSATGGQGKPLVGDFERVPLSEADKRGELFDLTYLMLE